MSSIGAAAATRAKQEAALLVEVRKLTDITHTPAKRHESAFRKFAALICPNCNYCEFPGCGTHHTLLTNAKGNGHASCSGCERKNHDCSTDKSSPWCDHCRDCKQSRADPMFWLMRDAAAYAMAVAVFAAAPAKSLQSQAIVATLALVCDCCAAAEIQTLDGALLTPAAHAAALARGHVFTLEHYDPRCTGPLRALPVSVSKVEALYLAGAVGTTRRLPAPRPDAAAFARPARWATHAAVDADPALRSLSLRSLPADQRYALAALPREPHPYPVWMSRGFVGQFGDPFVKDTELEGGHTKESLAYLAHYLSTLRARVTLTPADSLSNAVDGGKSTKDGASRVLCPLSPQGWRAVEKAAAHLAQAAATAADFAVVARLPAVDAPGVRLRNGHVVRQRRRKNAKASNTVAAAPDAGAGIPAVAAPAPLGAKPTEKDNEKDGESKSTGEGDNNSKNDAAADDHENDDISDGCSDVADSDLSESDLTDSASDADDDSTKAEDTNKTQSVVVSASAGDNNSDVDLDLKTVWESYQALRKKRASAADADTAAPPSDTKSAADDNKDYDDADAARNMSEGAAAAAFNRLNRLRNRTRRAGTASAGESASKDNDGDDDASWAAQAIAQQGLSPTVRDHALAALVRQHVDRLQRLQPGEAFVFPGGYMGASSGHAIMHVVVRGGACGTTVNSDPTDLTQCGTVSADEFDFITINTGNGLQFHPPQVTASKTRYVTALTVPRVPARRMLSAPFWLLYLRCLNYSADAHGAELLYQVLLPYLAGGALARAATLQPARLNGVYRTQQRAGSCYFRCVTECARHLMLCHGASAADWKAVSFWLRAAMLEDALRDLHVSRALYDASDVPMLRIAAKQTVNALCNWTRIGASTGGDASSKVGADRAGVPVETAAAASELLRRLVLALERKLASLPVPDSLQWAPTYLTGVAAELAFTQRVTESSVVDVPVASPAAVTYEGDEPLFSLSFTSPIAGAATAAVVGDVTAHSATSLALPFIAAEDGSDADDDGGDGDDDDIYAQDGSAPPSGTNPADTSSMSQSISLGSPLSVQVLQRQGSCDAPDGFGALPTEAVDAAGSERDLAELLLPPTSMCALSDKAQTLAYLPPVLKPESTCAGSAALYGGFDPFIADHAAHTDKLAGDDMAEPAPAAPDLVTAFDKVDKTDAAAADAPQSAATVLRREHDAAVATLSQLNAVAAQLVECQSLAHYHHAVHFIATTVTERLPVPRTLRERGLEVLPLQRRPSSMGFSAASNTTSKPAAAAATTETPATAAVAALSYESTDAGFVVEFEPGAAAAAAADGRELKRSPCCPWQDVPLTRAEITTAITAVARTSRLLMAAAASTDQSAPAAVARNAIVAAQLLAITDALMRVRAVPAPDDADADARAGLSPWAAVLDGGLPLEPRATDKQRFAIVAPATSNADNVPLETLTALLPLTEPAVALARARTLAYLKERAARADVLLFSTKAQKLCSFYYGPDDPELRLMQTFSTESGITLDRPVLPGAQTECSPQEASARWLCSCDASTSSGYEHEVTPIVTRFPEFMHWRNAALTLQLLLMSPRALRAELGGCLMTERGVELQWSFFRASAERKSIVIVLRFAGASNDTFIFTARRRIAASPAWPDYYIKPPAEGSSTLALASKRASAAAAAAYPSESYSSGTDIVAAVAPVPAPATGLYHLRYNDNRETTAVGATAAGAAAATAATRVFADDVDVDALIGSRHNSGNIDTASGFASRRDRDGRLPHSVRMQPALVAMRRGGVDSFEGVAASTAPAAATRNANLLHWADLDSALPQALREPEVLMAPALPTFHHYLSAEAAERLLCALAEPYARIPLVLAQFAAPGAETWLLNPALRELLSAVITEPARFQSAFAAARTVTALPAHPLRLGTPCGLLMNEVLHAPAAVLGPLCTLFDTVVARFAPPTTAAVTALDPALSSDAAVAALFTLPAGLAGADAEALAARWTLPTASAAAGFFFLLRLAARVERWCVFVLDALCARSYDPASPYCPLALPSPAALAATRAELTAGLAQLRRRMTQAALPLLMHWRRLSLAALTATPVATVVADDGATVAVAAVPDAVAMAAALPRNLAIHSHIALVLRCQREPSDATATAPGHPMFAYEALTPAQASTLLGAVCYTTTWNAGADESQSSAPAKAKTATATNDENAKPAEATPTGDEQEDTPTDSVGDDERADCWATHVPVPADELRALLAARRAPLHAWIVALPAATRSDVLSRALEWVSDPRSGAEAAAASGTEPSAVTWEPAAAAPGEFWNSASETSFSLLTGLISRAAAGVRPVPTSVSKHVAFATGVSGAARALVTAQSRRLARTTYSVFSRDITAHVWEPYSPHDLNAAAPRALTAAEAASGVEDLAVTAAESGASDAEATSSAAVVERHGALFRGVIYSRRYGTVTLDDNEEWVARLFEPFLTETYDKPDSAARHAALTFSWFLPHAPTCASAGFTALFGFDSATETWRLAVLSRHRATVQVFVLAEAGRVLYLSQAFTTAGALALSSFAPGAGSTLVSAAAAAGDAAAQERLRAQEQDRFFTETSRFARGNPTRPVEMEGSLVLRARAPAPPPRCTDSLLFPPAGSETMVVPQCLLNGLLPAVLLESFTFQLSLSDFCLRGAPIAAVAELPQWRFGLLVVPLRLPAAGLGSDAPATRVERPLEFLRLLGRVGGIVYRTPASSDGTTAALTEHNSVRVLVNLSCSVPGSALGRVADLSTRVEDLSHTLLWAKPAPELDLTPLLMPTGAATDAQRTAVACELRALRPVNGEERDEAATAQSSDRSALAERVIATKLTLDTLWFPRLNFTLVVRTDASGHTRLHSREHADMYVSDVRSYSLAPLFMGLPHALLMQSRANTFSLFLPSYPVTRPVVRVSPLSTDLRQERDNTDWLSTVSARYYLYSVHSSHTRVLPPEGAGLGPAACLFTLRMLHRNYADAASLIETCRVDTPLSAEEVFQLQQAEATVGDYHPDAVTVRLRLLTALLQCPTKVEWRAHEASTHGGGGGRGRGRDKYNIMTDAVEFASKRHRVSPACAFAPQELMNLLDTLQLTHALRMDDKPKPLPTEVRNLAMILRAELGLMARCEAEPPRGHTDWPVGGALPGGGYYDNALLDLTTGFIYEQDDAGSVITRRRRRFDEAALVTHMASGLSLSAAEGAAVRTASLAPTVRTVGEHLDVMDPAPPAAWQTLLARATHILNMVSDGSDFKVDLGGSLCYDRPLRRHMRGAWLVWLINRALKDDLGGGSERLGFLFILELLQGTRVPAVWETVQTRAERRTRGKDVRAKRTARAEAHKLKKSAAATATASSTDSKSAAEETPADDGTAAAMALMMDFFGSAPPVAAEPEKKTDAAKSKDDKASGTDKDKKDNKGDKPSALATALQTRKLRQKLLRGATLKPTELVKLDDQAMISEHRRERVYGDADGAALAELVAQWLHLDFQGQRGRQSDMGLIQFLLLQVAMRQRDAAVAYDEAMAAAQATTASKAPVDSTTFASSASASAEYALSIPPSADPAHAAEVATAHAAWLAHLEETAPTTSTTTTKVAQPAKVDVKALAMLAQSTPILQTQLNLRVLRPRLAKTVTVGKAEKDGPTPFFTLWMESVACAAHALVTNDMCWISQVQGQGATAENIKAGQTAAAAALARSAAVTLTRPIELAAGSAPDRSQSERLLDPSLLPAHLRVSQRELEELLSQPLFAADAPRHVALHGGDCFARTSDKDQEPTLPFDLVAHPALAAPQARAMLQRIQTDFALHARSRNAAAIPAVPELVDLLASAQSAGASTSEAVATAAAARLGAIVASLRALLQSDVVYTARARVFIEWAANRIPLTPVALCDFDASPMPSPSALLGTPLLVRAPSLARSISMGVSAVQPSELLRNASAVTGSKAGLTLARAASATAMIIEAEPQTGEEASAALRRPLAVLSPHNTAGAAFPSLNIVLKHIMGENTPRGAQAWLEHWARSSQLAPLSLLLCESTSALVQAATADVVALLRALPNSHPLRRAAAYTSTSSSAVELVALRTDLSQLTTDAACVQWTLRQARPDAAATEAHPHTVLEQAALDALKAVAAGPALTAAVASTAKLQDTARGLVALSRYVRQVNALAAAAATSGDITRAAKLMSACERARTRVSALRARVRVLLMLALVRARNSSDANACAAVSFQNDTLPRVASLVAAALARRAHLADAAASRIALLRGYAGEGPVRRVPDLVAGFMSTSCDGHDAPFLPRLAARVGDDESAARVMTVLAIYMLRVNRQCLVQRALQSARAVANKLATVGLISLRGTGQLPRVASPRALEVGCMLTLKQQARALALALTTGRFYATGVASDDSSEDRAVTVDPRFLAFEYTFDIVLRREQVELVRSFIGANTAPMPVINTPALAATSTATSCFQPLLAPTLGSHTSVRLRALRPASGLKFRLSLACASSVTDYDSADVNAAFCALATADKARKATPAPDFSAVTAAMRASATVTLPSCVHQMLMGAGKTTVVGPLTMLIATSQPHTPVRARRVVVNAVPSALLQMSTSVLRARFTSTFAIPVCTFAFQRDMGGPLGLGSTGPHKTAARCKKAEEWLDAHRTPLVYDVGKAVTQMFHDGICMRALNGVRDKARELADDHSNHHRRHGGDDSDDEEADEAKTRDRITPEFTRPFIGEPPAAADVAFLDELHAQLKQACERSAVVVCTDVALKSVMLKAVEVQNALCNLAKSLATRIITGSASGAAGAAGAAVETTATRAAVEAKTLEILTMEGNATIPVRCRFPHTSLQFFTLRAALTQLRAVLALLRRGPLVVDEVDEVMHPLRSELNFPIGERKRLEPAPARWQLPLALFDALSVAFVAATAAEFSVSQRIVAETDVGLPLSLSAHGQTALQTLASALRDGLAAQTVLQQPHLILLDAAFYRARMLAPIAEWVGTFLRANNVELPANSTVASTDDKNTIADYLLAPAVAPDCYPGSAIASAGLSETAVGLLNLSRDWVHTFLPHTLGKTVCVSYGLLSPAYLASRPTQPLSRTLTAVPYAGKDAPMPASEFAHPDVLAGFTVLAYLTQGLRRSDVRQLLTQLKAQLLRELGPQSERPAALLFDGWMRTALWRARPGEYASPAAVPVAAVPLSLATLQHGDPAQLSSAHRWLCRVPAVVERYLTQIVFPAVMKRQETNLSVAGFDLGATGIFASAIGFSGTPSDMLPAALGSCHFERGSEGKIVSTLTDAAVVSTTALSTDWTVRSVLRAIATAGADGGQPLHALIDTGALVTGLSNQAVASFLLTSGLAHVDGVVFLGPDDAPLVMLRGADRHGRRPVIPLAQCGLPVERRFTFYDQVHTVGIDVAQAPNAVAAVTLGKDMTLRHYSQGAYRMRGIGQGQRVSVFVPPEIQNLVATALGSDATRVPTPSDVVAWLLTTTASSEGVQFVQHCKYAAREGVRRAVADALVTAPTTMRPAYLQYFTEAITHGLEPRVPVVRSLAHVLGDEAAAVPAPLREERLVKPYTLAVAALAAAAAGSAQQTGAATGRLEQEMVNEQEVEVEEQAVQQSMHTAGFAEDDDNRPWELARFVLPASKSADATAFGDEDEMDGTASESTTAGNGALSAQQVTAQHASQLDADLAAHRASLAGTPSADAFESIFSIMTAMPEMFGTMRANWDNDAQTRLLTRVFTSKYPELAAQLPPLADPAAPVSATAEQTAAASAFADFFGGGFSAASEPVAAGASAEVTAAASTFADFFGGGVAAPEPVATPAVSVAVVEAAVQKSIIAATEISALATGPVHATPVGASGIPGLTSIESRVLPLPLAACYSRFFAPPVTQTDAAIDVVHRLHNVNIVAEWHIATRGDSAARAAATRLPAAVAGADLTRACAIAARAALATGEPPRAFLSRALKTAGMAAEAVRMDSASGSTATDDDAVAALNVSAAQALTDEYHASRAVSHAIEGDSTVSTRLVALTLAEAAGLRRALHSGSLHRLVAACTRAAGTNTARSWLVGAAVTLRVVTADGTAKPLDSWSSWEGAPASPAVAAAAAHAGTWLASAAGATALQMLRFLDNSVYFTEVELATLARALAALPLRLRKALFTKTAASRLRSCADGTGTPVERALTLPGPARSALAATLGAALRYSLLTRARNAVSSTATASTDHNSVAERAFALLDKTGHGRICVDDVAAALANAAATPEERGTARTIEARCVMQAMGSGADGSVSYRAFATWLMGASSAEEKSYV